MTEEEFAEVAKELEKKAEKNAEAALKRSEEHTSELQSR